MRAMALQRGGDEELWGVTGLLHDADYELHPDMDDQAAGHPRTILAELRDRDAPEEMIDAIAGHAPFLGVPRESDISRSLFAVDELSGFVVACSVVRPEGVNGMTPKSVKKKLKQPSFAAAVNREDIRIGAEELGVEQDVLITTVIGALQAVASELELNGSA